MFPLLFYCCNIHMGRKLWKSGNRIDIIIQRRTSTYTFKQKNTPSWLDSKHHRILYVHFRVFMDPSSNLANSNLFSTIGNDIFVFHVMHHDRIKYILLVYVKRCVHSLKRRISFDTTVKTIILMFNTTNFYFSNSK